MRLTSDFWVSAYVRRCNLEGAFAVVQRRGAAEAGAIFVLVDDLRGACWLYGGAPQSLLDDEGQPDRRFVLIQGPADAAEINLRLERELRFDSDLWIVAVEDRTARHFLDLV